MIKPGRLQGESPRLAAPVASTGTGAGRAASGQVSRLLCLFEAPRSAVAEVSRPGRTRRPAFGASPHVQPIPANVCAGAAAVGHHLARRQADTTHPADRDRDQTTRSGNQILLISHNQLPRDPRSRPRSRKDLKRAGNHVGVAAGSTRPGSVARSWPAVHALPPTDSMLGRGSAAERPLGDRWTVARCQGMDHRCRLRRPR
jgi:hypothetical protein